VAERRGAAPRSPRRLPRRRSTYALLCEVQFRFNPWNGLTRAIAKEEQAEHARGRKRNICEVGCIHPAGNGSLCLSQLSLIAHFKTKSARGGDGKLHSWRVDHGQNRARDLGRGEGWVR
jgi:hypothetical protein